MKQELDTYLKTASLRGHLWENGGHTIFVDNVALLPDKSLKVRNHSPDGFNWGYAGSGPAQLALAVMLELFPKETAEKKYQAFKFAVISQIPQRKSFEIEVSFDFWGNVKEFNFNRLY